jgi:hypothetical protein
VEDQEEVQEREGHARIDTGGGLDEISNHQRKTIKEHVWIY